MSEPKAASEPRRGGDPSEETYLGLVGERLRLTRAGRGMSRKVLAQASGVSERYLAELERGAGNASLLVLRQIAAAMSVRVADLVSETRDRSVDLTMLNWRRRVG
jgi:XRE family transcriptional regulator, aerobic/anaerobic benzoate catabolism transcriptional regulator